LNYSSIVQSEGGMKTSADGRSFIEAFEGKFLHTYDDGTGVLTIGYGHTSAAGPPAVFRGQTITDAECDSILANDFAAVERNVDRLITVPMTQNQFDALVSFDFNTGDLGKSSISTKINAGNSAAAMSTLLMYDHAGGRQMDGLTRRRQAERLMFNGLVQQALRLAGAHAATSTIPMPQAPSRPPVVVPAPPSITQPAKGSIGAAIANLILRIMSIFKRK
jgi:lysozyme